MTPKELAIHYTIGLWNDKNLSLIYEYLDRNVVLFGPNIGEILGYKAVEKSLYDWLEAFPDMVETIVHVISEGDDVAIHYKATGTHKEPFFGIPPTHKKITWEGLVIYKIKENKILEIINFSNMSTIINQL